MSVAFTKEESAETASETLLPDRPISEYLKLVTAQGLQALERQLQEAKTAFEAAQKTDDINERRRLSAVPLRDMRYLAERVRTAQVIAAPDGTDVVAFGSTVTLSRADGRERGEFDIVALGRALLADPAWVAKFRAGNADDIIAFDRSA